MVQERQSQWVYLARSPLLPFQRPHDEILDAALLSRESSGITCPTANQTCWRFQGKLQPTSFWIRQVKSVTHHCSLEGVHDGAGTVTSQNIPWVLRLLTNQNMLSWLCSQADGPNHVSVVRSLSGNEIMKWNPCWPHGLQLRAHWQLCGVPSPSGFFPWLLFCF